LEAAFAVVHKNNPSVNVLVTRTQNTSPVASTLGNDLNSWDALGDNIGVLDNWGQDLKVVNLFETQTYRDLVNMARRWFLAGYINPDVATGAVSGYELMKTESAFCYFHSNKPGDLEQEQINCGVQLYGAQLLPTFTYTNTAWQWGIGSRSVNPEKTMELLKLMYTDKDFLNTFIYGEQGIDYVVKNNGTIGFLPGVNTDTVGYNMAGQVWQGGNQFNAYVWESNPPDIWEQTRKWINEGYPGLPNHISKAAGFSFDSTPVKNEIAAINNVYGQYKLGLEFGALDPDVTIREMNTKMYAVGLQKVIDEKQNQLDVWARASGIK
jgi:putative aldouronate transport system substrate-binding protein